MNTETTKWVLIGSSILSFVAFVLALIALTTNNCGGDRNFEGDMMRGRPGNLIKQGNLENGENFRGRMMQRVVPEQNKDILGNENISLGSGE